MLNKEGCGNLVLCHVDLVTYEIVKNSIIYEIKNGEIVSYLYQ
jgi:hypothetical protein